VSPTSPRPSTYAAPNLLGDVNGILDALGVERTRVVGHDWGAFLSWAFASFFPDRVEKLVALSVGLAFGQAGIEQWEKSWYMLWFQFPGVAEAALPRDDWRLFREWTGDVEDMNRYIADLSRPGALTAGLNWYRANINPEMIGSSEPMPFPPIQCPTMGVWSDGDFALTERQMVESSDFVKGPWRYERIEGAGHWIPVDAPEELNGLLLDFLP